ncbi:MAG: hypothetical protein IPM42_15385 [Saprospiraceae bacterium]|nr:hypothetical protein [Saprospiraceae bacterium]
MYNLNENCTFAIQGTHNALDEQTPYRSSVASAGSLSATLKNRQYE